MNEKQKKSRQNNNVIKDVSDFPEISQSDDIPIYGHNEQEDKRPNTANQRQNVFWIMNNFNNHYQVPKINQ